MFGDRSCRAVALGLLVLVAASPATITVLGADWRIQDITGADALDKTSASVGAKSTSPASYTVWYKAGHVTFINKCAQDSTKMPIQVTWRDKGQQDLQHENNGAGQALLATMGDTFSNWAFSAYPLPWEAGLACPNCEQWTDLGSTTDCALQIKKPADDPEKYPDGTGIIESVFTCSTPDCVGRRIGSMWNTKQSATRKKLVAYCNPDLFGRGKPPGIACGSNSIIPFTFGSVWELSRDSANDQPDLSTNYNADVCRSDPCRISDNQKFVCNPDPQWCTDNRCDKTVWDNTVRAAANVWFNIPYAVDTNTDCTTMSPGGVPVYKKHWECMYAGCPDAYQTPVNTGAQWSCTNDAARWYTITFCPRGSVFVDDRDESPSLGGGGSQPPSGHKPPRGNRPPKSNKPPKGHKPPRRARSGSSLASTATAEPAVGVSSYSYNTAVLNAALPPVPAVATVPLDSSLPDHVPVTGDPDATSTVPVLLEIPVQPQAAAATGLGAP